MEPTDRHTRSAWAWVPSLYFAQGLPNAVVTSLSVVMYKSLQVSNTDIAFYTSSLYLPWVIKPLWAPLVELCGQERRWITALQFVTGLAFALIALTVPGSDFFRYSLALLWLMAFSSATHDIAADGFYLLALPSHQQAAFVGVRSTCFRLAMLAGKGGLVWLAGRLLELTSHPARAWSLIFGLLAVLFLLATAYHLWALPTVATDRTVKIAAPAKPGFFTVFLSFFAKPNIVRIITFLLLYRLGEALALKLAEPFLLDPRSKGGLGLTVKEVGLAYGGVGMLALLAGGLLGGYLISCFGLRRLLWPMVFVMHMPIIVFLLLATTQPTSLFTITAALSVEQFGYGFGFTAYMVYLMMISKGEHQTAHYAIGTGFMALSIMLPGLKAGSLQTQLGYVPFFAWVCAATIPSFIATALIRVDADAEAKS